MIIAEKDFVTAAIQVSSMHSSFMDITPIHLLYHGIIGHGHRTKTGPDQIEIRWLGPIQIDEANLPPVTQCVEEKIDGL